MRELPDQRRVGHVEVIGNLDELKRLKILLVSDQYLRISLTEVADHPEGLLGRSWRQRDRC